MIVVDPRHWLSEDGHFIVDSPRLYRQMLRIARFIEYGGELERNETRETLMECRRRHDAPALRNAAVGITIANAINAVGVTQCGFRPQILEM